MAYLYEKHAGKLNGNLMIDVQLVVQGQTRTVLLHLLGYPSTAKLFTCSYQYIFSFINYNILDVKLMLCNNLQLFALSSVEKSV